MPAARSSTTGTNRRFVGGAPAASPAFFSAASSSPPVSTSRRRGAATYAPTRVAPLHSGEARMREVMAAAVGGWDGWMMRGAGEVESALATPSPLSPPSQFQNAHSSVSISSGRPASLAFMALRRDALADAREEEDAPPPADADVVAIAFDGSPSVARERPWGTPSRRRAAAVVVWDRRSSSSISERGVRRRDASRWRVKRETKKRSVAPAPQNENVGRLRCPPPQAPVRPGRPGCDRLALCRPLCRLCGGQ